MLPHRHIRLARTPVTHRAGVCVVILLAFACPAWAGDSCPQNTIVVSRTDVSFPSTTSTASIEWTEGLGDQIVPWTAGQPCTEACYDLPNGTIVARGFNTLYGPGATWVSVCDDFVVVGPAGPPLQFEVVLQMNATIDIEGSVAAGLTVPGSPSQTIQLAATGFMELALPVVVAPGTPFQLNAFATAVGGHLGGIGLAEARIRFRGLPVAYAVTSCQGYDQETPTRPATWGGIKAQYR